MNTELPAFKLLQVDSSWPVRCDIDKYLIKSRMIGKTYGVKRTINLYFDIEVLIPKNHIGELIVNFEHKNAKNIVLPERKMISSSAWEVLSITVEVTGDYHDTINYNKLFMLVIKNSN